MRLLLDTHFLIWGLQDVGRLTSSELKAMSSPENTIYFSLVNLWEIAIEVGQGRLTVGPNFPSRVLAEPGLKLMPIKIEHVWCVQDLPRLHGDPFDRLLVSQARVERLAILTRDRGIRRYDVEVFSEVRRSSPRSYPQAL